MLSLQAYDFMSMVRATLAPSDSGLARPTKRNSFATARLSRWTNVSPVTSTPGGELLRESNSGSYVSVGRAGNKPRVS